MKELVSYIGERLWLACACGLSGGVFYANVAVTTDDEAVLVLHGWGGHGKTIPTIIIEDSGITGPEQIEAQPSA